MKKMRVVAMLLACAMLATSCSKSEPEVAVAEDAVIMQIDGEDIMKSEYLVYLYTTTQSFVSMAGEEIWTMEFDGMTADEAVEERTLDTLRKVKASVKYAEENGITLTEEQATEAATSASQFMTYIPEADLAVLGVTEEDLTILMEESYIFSSVYQAMAAGCVIDEDALQVYSDENREAYREQYTYLDFDCVVVDDATVADEVLTKALAGDDFTALFDEYDIDEAAKETEDKGKASMYKSDFLTSFGIAELPEVGIQDEVMIIDLYFFIMNVEYIGVPTDEECDAMMEYAYQEEQMVAYAEAKTAELIAEQEMVYMEDVFATVTPFHD